MDVPKDIGARYLCQAERILIADRPGAGDSIRAIARRLGRPASTVSREVRRNSDPGAGGYGPYRAQQAAADRRKRPKARKARVGTRLWDEIRAGIKRHWSPEQTGHRLDADFPDNGDMHACTETIYQAIYIQGRGELNREPMVMTGERPAEVGDRAVPGHWGGRPGLRQGQQDRHRHARGARHQVHDPACACPTDTTPNTSNKPSSARCAA